MIGSGLLWEGFRESRRCSRDTYPESYITEYTSVYEDKHGVGAPEAIERKGPPPNP